MENSTVSLKMTQISSAALPTAPASNRYFTFSKQFAREKLAEGFSKKAPSQVATALNVMKIAPALFFMIEKLAAALETVLNAGASLLGCSASAFDNHEIIVVDNSGKADKTLAAPTPVKVETTIVEEPASPVKKEETPVATAPTPEKEKTPEQPPVVQPQPETPKEDVLDKDLLVEPIVPPPAASNRARNLVIGAGLAALIGGIGCLAIGYFNKDPINQNPFDPDTMCGLEEPPLTEADVATCHPNSGEMCDLSTPSWKGKLFNIQQPVCHPDSGEMCDLPDTPTCHPNSGEMCDLSTPSWKGKLFNIQQPVCHPDSGEICDLPDTATCHADDTQTCWATTQLLNGEIKRMSEEERIQRDILLALYEHNSTAFEFGEQAELCWHKKHDSNNAYWCEKTLCQNAPICDDESIKKYSQTDGSPYTAFKETSGDHCLEVTCNEYFACDNDPICED